ncbi:hypothetical protein WJX72_011628 [[Myrmecia] bisecta]|uniref:Zinc-finger domain-containing protein n=1 Tax=[Myrmecia] bisecta TaxID=41462 RepID=A0AAW1RAT0_9CHLO
MAEMLLVRQSKRKLQRRSVPPIPACVSSETGTTCHQCRQKTVELKAKCTDCTLYWCPRCLTNRYGEEVEEVSKLAKWPCPRCRGACNCSNCRKKRGLEATGILANVSKKAGFTSVSDLLAKNPNAKRPPALPKPADEADNIRQRTAPGVQRKPSAKVAAMELVEDCKLGERPAAMPVGSALCIHKPMGATRRARGLGWPDELGTSTPVPEGCNPGDLAEVLEFLQVFAAETGLETLQLSVVAAELLQPSTSEGRSAFGDPKASAAGQVHMQLLDLVRKDWGIKGSVGMGGWQEVMRLYLQQQAAFAPSASRLPACNAFSEDPMEVDEVEGEAPTEARSPAVAELAAGAVLVEYPAGGYWALVPELRLSMLRDLVHDALATSTLRARIEAAQDGAAAEGKGRKDELAAARKQAREAWQKQRDQEVALLITTGGAKGMTIEEQKALMEEGRLKVEAAATSAALVKVAALEASLHNTAVRGVPLGSERDGTRFWDLQCAPVLTGQAASLS